MANSKLGIKTIEEVTETLIDYRGKTPRKTTEGVKLITAKVIKDGFILDGPHEYIAEDEYDAWMRRGLPRQWDILITTEAPLGEVAQLRTAERVALAQRVILLRGNPEVIDQAYYFQMLKSPFVQGELRTKSSGTTVLGIKQSELRKVRVPCPPLTIQRKIAGILSAYDDLIENNTRRIKILEEMARTIYREWFVEFRVPGVKLRKAMPEEKKVTGKDVFPAGWELRPLGDMIELAYGKGLKADQRMPGHVPVYGSAGVVGYHSESLVKGPGIIVGRKGNVGSVFWSDDDFYPIDTVFYVRTALGLHYVYYNLQGQNFINNDAAVPGLSRNQAYLNTLVVPATQTLTAFSDFIEPMFRQVHNLQAKNANLRRTRDLLLPRLVSGELDVENVEVRMAG